MLLRSAQPARGQFGTISGTLIYYMATYIDWVAQLAQLMTCSRVSLLHECAGDDIHSLLGLTISRCNEITARHVSCRALHSSFCG